MAKNNEADMSCARVKKYTASDVSKADRHNERKNETYENMNVIEHAKQKFAEEQIRSFLEAMGKLGYRREEIIRLLEKGETEDVDT